MGVLDKKLLIALFITVFISFEYMPSPTFIGSVQAQSEYPFEQEIILPLDENFFSLSIQHQPIDISVNFDNPCWAKNETMNSVRVGYIEENDFIEIESQIYALQKTDDDHISSCRLVFLIPETFSSKKPFLVKYSDSETAPADYQDHLSLKRSHFHYEPISGQSINFDYYGITQDGIIPYVISTKGSLFGNGISQVVARLKPNSKTLDTTRIDQFASFSMLFSTDEYEDLDYVGTSFSTNVKTTVLVDGNLFVKLRIESISPNELIKTSNVYSYYYCPGEPKRMNVHVTHEILETCEMGGSYALDGTYAYLLSFHSQSNAIEKLNMGSILPELYLFSEDERVQSYSIPVNPDSAEQEMILDTSDDIDLGSEAWLCIHHPETKKTHGLIFAKNQGIANKDQDGLQVKSFVEETLKIPGLEVDTGSVYASRNHYETGGEQRLTLEKGFKASFDVAFISFQQGSWCDVSNESNIYQELISSRETTIETNGTDEVEEKSYSLSGAVTGVRSFPFGSLLSAYTGKNFSYLSAELHQDNTLVSSTVVSRIPLNMVSSDVDATSLKNLIQLARIIIDWKNTSILQRFHFSQIPAGDYIIKIYKENPFFSDSKTFVGYSFISLTEDSQVHIHEGRTVSVSVTTTDQQNNPLQDVTIQIVSNDVVITQSKTDLDGTTLLEIPYYQDENYHLNFYYQNIPVYQSALSFSMKHYLKPSEHIIQIPLYDLSLTIHDEWNLPPSVSLRPELHYESQNNPYPVFLGTKIDNAQYVFQQIPKESYTFIVSYKQFEHVERIDLNQNKELSIDFPVTYETTIAAYNRIGLPISNVDITINREEQTKTYSLNADNLSVSIPPGTYEIQITKDDSILAKQSVLIFSQNIKHIITNQDSLLLTIGFILSIILIISSIGIGFIRKHYYQGFLLLFAGIILLSALSPWWILTGSTNGITTETSIHLLPTQMISFTETPVVFSGEFQELPDEANLALTILLVFLILTFCVLFFLQFIPHNYKKLVNGAYISCIFIMSIIIAGFIYFVSQLTVIGVGTSSGAGLIDFTLTGASSSIQLQAEWGFATGLYISFLALIVLIIYPLLMKRKMGSWQQSIRATHLFTKKM